MIVKSRTPKIVGIGANVFDTLIKLPAFPTENTKMPVEAVLPSGGGPCATGLVAAARLGGHAAWIGNLSNDQGGLFLLEDFKRFGVATELLEIKNGYRSFSATVLLSENTGSRTCLLDRGNLPALELNAKQIEAIEQSDILLVDGNELEAAVEAAKYARKGGSRVLYDAGGLYPGIEKLLAQTDFLIPSEEFALNYTGKTDVQDAALELQKEFRPEAIVITQGRRGGFLYRHEDFTKFPAFEIEHVVDSNGAGDVFHGAFAFAVTQAMLYEECCVFASAVSALKCTRLGARLGTPTYPEVRTFLENSPYYAEFRRRGLNGLRFVREPGDVNYQTIITNPTF